ncbi:hypothetical protein HZA86_03390 [Candidatus Uhrbacteria bacterium]|nr:hypothetical protein [Candidatus Uhrbacteria bacterium]
MLKSKVLIVEDDPGFIRKYQHELADVAGQAQFIYASDTRQAEALFRANPDIVLITMDAALETGSPQDGVELTKRFRCVFPGPIIAAAATLNNKHLVKAGCDHCCEKYELAQKVRDLLQRRSMQR